MSFVKVSGGKYIRDARSNGLTSTDITGLEEYKTKRRLLKTQKEEINNMRVDIDNIKNDIHEVRDLLYKLLEK